MRSCFVIVRVHTNRIWEGVRLKCNPELLARFLPFDDLFPEPVSRIQRRHSKCQSERLADAYPVVGCSIDVSERQRRLFPDGIRHRTIVMSIRDVPA